jgi:NADH-quinone oxidoreductase subunit J
MIPILLTALLGGVGAYLLLPHRLGKARPRAWRAAGGALAALAVLGFALALTPPPVSLATVFFYGFTLLAALGALLMVTSRNPVYSALWFAMVVLSTSGLFLLAGAQFLAAGTIIVYAGAIIVTFLFVIMLAQSEGNALYDRLARAPGRSALVAFAMIAGLVGAILGVSPGPAAPSDAADAPEPLPRMGAWLARVDEVRTPAPHRVVARSVSAQDRMLPEPSERAANGSPPPHMAGLGGTLYTDHLVSVEVAGAVLFVALVGAAAIATPRPPVRPDPARAAALR